MMWGTCVEYEPDHPIWYESDAVQMLKDGIIDEEDLMDAEIIPDPMVSGGEDA